jgi:hypothetical protein
MNLDRAIPEFFIARRNTLIQIIFTALFAYTFILIYHPFGSQDWFEVNTGQFAFYVGFVVVLGMLVVIISRVIMTQIRKKHKVTISGYALMIGMEILAMTGFYMMIQKVFLKDQRFWFEVYYTAILNTTLILLIPYLISLLYFAWLDKKRNFEQLLVSRQPGSEALRFVNFMDESGEIRLSIQLNEVLYLEASENYVTIHYLNQNQPERILLRNSMKRLEAQLSDYQIIRCHRSYMVNLSRISLMRKIKSGLVVDLASADPVRLPVSETYKEYLINALRNQDNRVISE